jgi:glucose/arabinose dehydrogenase
MKVHSLFASMALGVCLPASASASQLHESQHLRFQSEVLLESLAHPWSIAFLSEGEWLITERAGRLRHVRDGELVSAPVSGVPDVIADNQGGLLDVVLHPDFRENAYIYLSYAKRCSGNGNTTAVGRGRWEDGALKDFEELYSADACAPGGRHHGSRIVFDRDGYMYVSIGDRGVQKRAQDPSDNAGVTLRLHDDGRIPASNPFAGKPAGHDANWTWGNRNIQGMAVHPQTGEIWSHEHGPRGGDEINLLLAGRNYGWPTVTYGTEYSGAPITDKTEAPGMEPPLKQWTPSIAPSGMAFVTGDAFKAWENDILVGALAHQHIARLRFDGHEEVEEERLLVNDYGRIRDVRVGPDGLIYVLTDSPKGQLIRLRPAG